MLALRIPCPRLQSRDPEDKEVREKEAALAPGPAAYSAAVRTGLCRAYLAASVVGSRLVSASKTGGGVGKVGVQGATLAARLLPWTFFKCACVCVCGCVWVSCVCAVCVHGRLWVCESRLLCMWCVRVCGCVSVSCVVCAVCVWGGASCVGVLCRCLVPCIG